MVRVRVKVRVKVRVRIKAKVRVRARCRVRTRIRVRVRRRSRTLNLKSGTPEHTFPDTLLFHTPTPLYGFPFRFEISKEEEWCVCEAREIFWFTGNIFLLIY